MDCLKSKQNEEQETESEYTSMQQQKKDEEMNNVQIMQKNRRWLGSLAVLDIVFSLFIMFWLSPFIMFWSPPSIMLPVATHGTFRTLIRQA